MNCFELAKNVLDRSFSLIEGDQAQKVAVINGKINALLGRPQTLNKPGLEWKFQPRLVVQTLAFNL